MPLAVRVPTRSMKVPTLTCERRFVVHLSQARKPKHHQERVPIQLLQKKVEPLPSLWFRFENMKQALHALANTRVPLLPLWRFLAPSQRPFFACAARHLLEPRTSKPRSVRETTCTVAKAVASLCKHSVATARFCPDGVVAPSYTRLAPIAPSVPSMCAQTQKDVLSTGY